MGKSHLTKITKGFIIHKMRNWAKYELQHLKAFLNTLENERADFFDLLLNIRYSFHLDTDDFIWYPHFFFVAPSKGWRKWCGGAEWYFHIYLWFWEFRITKEENVFYFNEAQNFGTGWKYYHKADGEWYDVGTKRK